ncbi:bifunctional glycosyltransferase family 2/GtrA family protein [Enterococcus sp. BWM-S5]|uniref:Bifunctional glycosyltransferase family 2/GtrA family protein n=1 Tax=Enterococcus larvae TaxID=2794352 RepID=A0ABS4CLJ1_9ENTE|nr:bifunctional glycosyltransferase family 2/GtrA family protein [Enterococcus larvae]MBP1047459.1 bifunctional glycosyltransferase family 2/GtrA family protein [Enterococcus larvae]
MSVMLLIPSYEPQEKVFLFVQQLEKETGTQILIVDDGSGVRYQKIFQKLSVLPSVTVLSYPVNKGKGAALKIGFQKIMSDYPDVDGVVTADSDGQHSIDDIKRMIAAVESVQTHTLILGTRSFNKKKTPFKSYWGNRISAIFFYFATGLKCEDTQTGLRAMKHQLLPELLTIEGERFEYEMNVLLQSKERKIQLEQLPIETIYESNNEHSHFRAIQDSYLIYKPLIRYISSALFSFLIDMTVFLLLLFLLGNSEDIVVPATIIARVISGVVNYLLARAWVFEDKSRVQTTLWKYGLLFLGQMFLSSIGVQLLLKFLPIAFISKLLVDSLLFGVSFIIQNRIVFQKWKVME